MEGAGTITAFVSAVVIQTAVRAFLGPHRVVDYQLIDLLYIQHILSRAALHWSHNYCYEVTGVIAQRREAS